jgi:hypothetical protein
LFVVSLVVFQLEKSIPNQETKSKGWTGGREAHRRTRTGAHAQAHTHRRTRRRTRTGACILVFIIIPAVIIILRFIIILPFVVIY